MKLKITKTFRFAHNGTEIVEYLEGEVYDVEDPELEKVALEEKWAEPVKGKAGAPENKALNSAPDNK